MNNALVITPSAFRRFSPQMRRGDPETQAFAAASNIAMDIGGISMCLSSTITRDTLEKAILQLQAIQETLPHPKP